MRWHSYDAAHELLKKKAGMNTPQITTALQAARKKRTLNRQCTISSFPKRVLPVMAPAVVKKSG
jgi:hypothetical protein